MIMLPRQARDKHREGHTKKSDVLLQWSNGLKATFAQGGGGEAVNTVLRVANDLRDAVLALARQPPRPASHPLGGVGLVESATALHRDCESKKVMCSHVFHAPALSIV